MPALTIDTKPQETHLGPTMLGFAATMTSSTILYVPSLDYS